MVPKDGFLIIFFFFSSRRRHTRYWRDWSSDVCSSDLGTGEGQAVFPRLPGGVLVGVHEAGCPLAFQVEASQGAPDHAWCDHDNVHLLGWSYMLEGDVVPGGEVQRLARAQGWPDVLLVHAWSDFVGDEHKAHLRPFGGLPYRYGGEAVLLGLLPALVTDAAHRHVLHP